MQLSCQQRSPWSQDEMNLSPVFCATVDRFEKQISSTLYCEVFINLPAQVIIDLRKLNKLCKFMCEKLAVIIREDIYTQNANVTTWLVSCDVLNNSILPIIFFMLPVNSPRLHNMIKLRWTCLPGFEKRRRQSIICHVRVARPTDYSQKTDSECQQNCRVFFQCLAPHWSTFFAKSCFSYRHWVPFLVRTCAPLLSFKFQNFATTWSQSSRGPKFGSIFKNLKNARTHFTWLLENKDGCRGFCWIVELICRDLLNL